MTWQWRPEGISRGVALWVGGAVVLVFLVMILAPMMIVGGSSLLLMSGSGCTAQETGSSQPGASSDAKNSIPANYLALFQSAGAKYGVPWVILAGIGKVESDDGQSDLPGVSSGANAYGAAGPMQIGIGGASGNEWGGAPIHPASEQVNGVATDGDGDGIDNVYDPADAIAGAAKLLLQDGVQGDPAGAIFDYNHSQTYVSDVLSLAAQYSQGGYTVSTVSADSVPSCLPGVSVGAGPPYGVGQAPNDTVATAIAYAQAQLGKPYLFGGTGPDAFDCSGLVMMAYRAAGVDIPRTSEEQWAWGPQIPASQAEPGDLVFFTGSSIDPPPGHVGLVIGGGMMIEAYATGYPIRIAPYGDRDPTGFTRPWEHAGVTLGTQSGTQ